MLTKSHIVDLLRTNDRAVARALVVLTERQTRDERASETTRHLNGEGFRPCHARMGTSMANFFKRNGYLSPKQIAYWRAKDKTGKMRIEIYAGQLLAVAEAKAAVVKPVAPAAAAPNPHVGQDIGNLSEERLALCERFSSTTDPAERNEIERRIDLVDKAINAWIETEMERRAALEGL
jgi:hypothetical protein